jgi:hypothetical protein
VDAHRLRTPAVSLSCATSGRQVLIPRSRKSSFERRQENRGAPYGTFGSRDNQRQRLHKAFDGDTKTFFDAVAPNAQYLGIEIKSGNDRVLPRRRLSSGMACVLITSATASPTA